MMELAYRQAVEGRDFLSLEGAKIQNKSLFSCPYWYFFKKKAIIHAKIRTFAPDILHKPTQK